MFKRIWWKVLLGLVGLILLALVGLVIWLSVTEYKPADRQSAERIVLDPEGEAVGTSLTIYTWNIGYAGLGADSDFFMDGGSMVDPPSQEAVEENLAAIIDFIQSNEADAWLLQEVDLNSKRTGYLDELAAITEAYGGSSAFAYNYKCAFVPIPVPAIGRVESGIATLTSAQMVGETERISLPCPFSWPVSTANLKRCLLVTRLAVEGTEKELVLVNLHLEAYDDGEGKIAQTKMLMEFIQQEYEKGNYVIAGGDFNQTFPGTLEGFPIMNSKFWTPGVMQEEDLPEGFQYAFDPDMASCRLLGDTYDCGGLDYDGQFYVLDGFIVSPNVQIDSVQTINLGFENSDHNPVKLEVTLLED